MRLAKALPFQRAQVEMRDALAAHEDLHIADGAYAQVALFPSHTGRHGDVMIHTQRQQGVGRAFRPFLHVTGPPLGAFIKLSALRVVHDLSDTDSPCLQCA